MCAGALAPQVQVFTSNELAIATGGVWEGPSPQPKAGPLAIDTRSLSAGAWYLAVRGAAHDGHRFAAAALAAGAAGVVAEAGVDLGLDGPAPVLRVPNTREAFGAIARFHRRRWGGSLLGLTGSSGKTTTKELVAAALAVEGPCHATTGNHNNEIGVPLTLLALEAQHLTAVVEMGMRGLGQIAELAAWAEPTAGLITNAGVAHLELLGSVEAIAQAKAELWAALPASGVAIAPTGPGQERLAPHLAKHPGVVLRFGLEEEAEAEVAAGPAEGAGPGRMALKVLWRQVGGPTLEALVDAPGWGEHQRRNVAAAVAARVALQRPWLEKLSLSPRQLAGRQAIREVGGVRLVDDAYNANPASLKAAAAAFATEPGPWARRFVVVGPMAELGPQAPELHAEAGLALADLGLAGLWAVGRGAGAYAGSGAALQVAEDFGAAAEALAQSLRPGDAVLFKASRSVGLEALVDAVAQRLSAQEASC